MCGLKRSTGGGTEGDICGSVHYVFQSQLCLVEPSLVISVYKVNFYPDLGSFRETKKYWLCGLHKLAVSLRESAVH